jgi:hypothetical protein
MVPVGGGYNNASSPVGGNVNPAEVREPYVYADSTQ